MSADTVADASRSKLHALHIGLDQSGSRLHLKLPKRLDYFRLNVSGDLSRFSADGDMPYSLTLAPRTSRSNNGVPFLLPDLGELDQVRMRGSVIVRYPILKNSTD